MNGSLNKRGMFLKIVNYSLNYSYPNKSQIYFVITIIRVVIHFHMWIHFVYTYWGGDAHHSYNSQLLESPGPHGKFFSGPWMVPHALITIYSCFSDKYFCVHLGMFKIIES